MNSGLGKLSGKFCEPITVGLGNPTRPTTDSRREQATALIHVLSPLLILLVSSIFVDYLLSSLKPPPANISGRRTQQRPVPLVHSRCPPSDLTSNFSASMTTVLDEEEESLAHFLESEVLSEVSDQVPPDLYFFNF